MMQRARFAPQLGSSLQASSATSSAPSSRGFDVVQRRFAIGYCYWNCSSGFSMPDGPNPKKHEIPTMFTPKARDKWNYNRINEQVDSQSEFRDMSNRPDFTGPRQDNTMFHEQTMGTPKHYRLGDWFDAYSPQKGKDPKKQAAEAVNEAYDSEEFYYPGEKWKKNAPAFRSVPKEILNKYTWYRNDLILKCDEVSAHIRNRSWFPMWPPPGTKVPTKTTKKEFEFGVEDPGLVCEIERYAWYRNWMEINIRIGFQEVVQMICLVAMMLWLMRMSRDNGLWNTKANNAWYPGRSILRSYGEIRDPETDYFWWQKPLSTFPNQGEIYFLRKLRHGWPEHLAREKERKKMEEVVNQ